MGIYKEGAAPGKHQLDGPPRLNSSRCGTYHTSANAFIQSSSGVSPTVGKTPDGGRMNQDLVQQSKEKVVELSVIERVVMQGDLSKLNPEQRVVYYRKVCESAGLNPFTRPFDYIVLNGKLSLYAKKDCTEQLRKLNGISIESLEDKMVDDIYIVTARAKDKTGRVDQAKGAVTIGNLKGDAKANAIMKAETKAKRRVTLSISGLGWVDETEIETIPNARPVEVDMSTGEIKGSPEMPPPMESTIDQAPKLSFDQVSELEIILDECDEKYRNWVYEYVRKTFKTSDLSGVRADMYDRMKSAAVKNMAQNHARQRDEEQADLMTAEAL